MPSPRQLTDCELTDRELTGRSRSHVIDAVNPRCTLQPAVMSAFFAMRTAAQSAGIDLRAASSFRDFDRQVLIWNGKYRGERLLQDRAGQILDVQNLSPAERVDAILVWSALPGASRHHWGTDFDVFDAAALSDESMLQLVPQEYQEGGPFAKLSGWLDTNMQRFGFFRPYCETIAPTPGATSVASALIGVSPEPWHLSFAPLASRYLGAITPELLASALRDCKLEGRDAVLAKLDEIHGRYVVNVAAASAESLAFEFRNDGRMV